MPKSTKASKAVKEFIDPPSTKLQDWNWRPLEAVSKDLSLTEVPDYIQKGYGSFMADQAARAAAGKLTSRDLLKAYLITQSSIGRQGLAHSTATKAGLKVPRTDELVRPEGAFATWLGSKAGQKYLDAAMKGDLDEKAIAEIQYQFSPFGKQNALGESMVYAANTIPEMSKRLNQTIMGTPEDYRDYAEGLKGIAGSKSGFIGSMLGRGDLPTFDARQIYLHTAGEPLPTATSASILNRGKGLGGREAVDRLAARQSALGLKLDPALDPHYQHLAHHAVWDKIGGSQTTHQDLIDAMTNYKDGGKVKRRDIDEFKLLGEDEAARARPFDTGYRKPAPKQTPMEKLDATLKQQGSFAAPRPRTTTASQYEKDFRDYVANQQAARQQLMSDLVSPSRIANAAVPGAVGALTGYGSQMLGGAGDLVGLYEEFKPKSWASAPTSLQSLPSTEQVQELFAPEADSFIGRRMPEYEAGITGGNLYALGEAAYKLPSFVRGVGRGAKALGKEAGRRIDEAMLTGEGMLGSALAPARPNFIKAYHGTPHRFPPTAKNPLGEFDPTKIGTGEGAQAYGYGHYLAEQKDVAKSYANDLAGIAGARGSRVKPAPEESIANDVQHFLGEDIGGHAAGRAEKIYSRSGKTIYEFEDGSLGLLDSQGNFQAFAKPESSLYKVDLPDEVVPRMLDWDRPFSQQSDAVRQALQNAGIVGKDDWLISGMKGREIYNRSKFGAPVKLPLNQVDDQIYAAQRLREAGIPGIQYLDAGSRRAGAGTGTRNFVVFPGGEDLLTIEERMKKGGTVSQDTMRIKSWDKKIKGKAAGGQVQHMSTAGVVKPVAQKIVKPTAQLASKVYDAILGEKVALTPAADRMVALPGRGREKGGPLFPWLSTVDPNYEGIVWANKGRGATSKMINAAADNPGLIFTPQIGAPEMHRSNQVTYEKILRAFERAQKKGELTPELRDAYNDRLKTFYTDENGNPLFGKDFDIAKTNLRKEANTFPHRAAIAEVLGGVGTREYGFKNREAAQIIPYSKIIQSTTEPELINAPTGSLGPRFFQLTGERDVRPDLHAAFPEVVSGVDLGFHYAPTPRELVFQDFIKQIQNAKGRDPGHMDWDRNRVIQQVTPEIVHRLQDAGFKDGGAVNMAEGGMTSDDLIVEERPL